MDSRAHFHIDSASQPASERASNQTTKKEKETGKGKSKKEKEKKKRTADSTQWLQTPCIALASSCC